MNHLETTSSSRLEVAKLNNQLKTVSNSRLVSGAVKHLQPKDNGDHPAASTASAQSKKSILWIFTMLRIIPPLPTRDLKSAFESLLSLQGFEEWKPRIMGLQKQVETLKGQGDLRKKRAAPHIVIFCEDGQTATDFAQHYHAFLTAAGVFTPDEKLVRADGTNDRALSQAYGCGMCLIRNTDKLSSTATTELSSRMRSKDTVIIANYTESVPMSLKFSEDNFLLHFDFLQALSKIAVPEILDTMKFWSKQNFNDEMKLEGEFNGPYARTFAYRIAENKKSEKGSMEERLDSALEDVTVRQIRRLAQDIASGKDSDPFWISREDLLGQAPDTSTFYLKAWSDLQSMIGLHEVKASLESFVNGVLVDFHRELHDKKPLRSGLSGLFLGPPGTGKTTVGKLYGEILSSLGILTPGEFILKNATDFIGVHIGESENQTREILDEARGKVLMIDEAYMLDPFRKASDRCLGHFGFCRNLPRPGDDLVLLPGLADPVILRRRPSMEGVNCYRVVGITRGMLGPPLLNEAGEEMEGAFCFGTCAEMESSNDHEPRSFCLQ